MSLQKCLRLVQIDSFAIIIFQFAIRTWWESRNDLVSSNHFNLIHAYIWPCKHMANLRIYVCQCCCSSGSSENSRLAAFTWLGELVRIISFVNLLSRLLETSFFFRSSVPLTLRSPTNLYKCIDTWMYRLP